MSFKKQSSQQTLGINSNEIQDQLLNTYISRLNEIFIKNDFELILNKNQEASMQNM